MLQNEFFPYVRPVLIQVASGLTVLHYKGASILSYATDPTWLCYRLRIKRFQRLIRSLENRFLKESFGSESFSLSLMRINEKYRFLDATLFPVGYKQLHTYLSIL